MAHSLSAKKRVRQNQKHRAVNRWRKRRIHDAVREFEAKVHGGLAAEAAKALQTVSGLLDRVAGKKAIHKNAAARKKSRLSKRLKAMKTTATK